MGPPDPDPDEDPVAGGAPSAVLRVDASTHDAPTHTKVAPSAPKTEERKNLGMFQLTRRAPPET
jgi:hypothetical protein